MGNKDFIIDSKYSSPNFTARILHLVFHYTAANFEQSIKILTDPKQGVSAHYLVPPSLIDGKYKVYQLVAENERAWHAGISNWRNRTNINDTSIGIEIVNPGYTDDEEGKRTWYSFSDEQIQILIKLVKDIVKRYNIQAVNIIGHGDIAPGRKVDPGPLFPWKKLHENGIGAWFNEEELELKEQETIDIQRMQKNLQTYGYGIEITGKLDPHTWNVVQAFQMHFNPNNYSNAPNAKTIAILENLVQKYFPNQVQPNNPIIKSKLSRY